MIRPPEPDDLKAFARRLVRLLEDRQVLYAICGSFAAMEYSEPRLSIDGDRQSDLDNHGGRDKAVYAYPAEHYERWRAELPGVDLPWGAFGENLTVSGLEEAQLGVGDCLRVGTALVMVTMPRLPCFKLGLRLGRPDIVKRLEASGRCGSYLRVLEEGEVRAGDVVECTAAGAYGITIAELFRLIMATNEDGRLLRIASTLPTIPERARERFTQRLATAAAADADDTVA